jgi:hypothetical protein
VFRLAVPKGRRKTNSRLLLTRGEVSEVHLALLFRLAKFRSPRALRRHSRMKLMSTFHLWIRIVSTTLFL